MVNNDKVVNEFNMAKVKDLNFHRLAIDEETINQDLLETGDIDEEYYQDDDVFYDDEFYHGNGLKRITSSQLTRRENPNKQTASFKMAQIQPSDLTKRCNNKVNLEKFEGASLPSHAVTQMIKNEKKTEDRSRRRKDKSDRATIEKVLDARVKKILFDLINRRIIDCVNGCISTGKEANVYHAPSQNGELALKIYQTSILEFRHRGKYVDGEYRFRGGLSKSNPRRKVQLWAEKEFRNLKRMHKEGLNVPKPMSRHNHVLLIEFIGRDGVAAPKLKDADLSESEAVRVYRDVLILMWKMYNTSKLVHADLSEYNMLYFDGKVYIIDVSQSVEHDHKEALNFLRTDIENVTNFFSKKGLVTLGLRDLFDFITDPSITDDNMQKCLIKFEEKAAQSGTLSAADQINENVFKHVYIPQTMDEVPDMERDLEEVKSGIRTDLVYATLVGLKGDLSGTVQIPQILHTSDEKHEESSESEDFCDSDSIESADKISKFMNSCRPKNETLEEKKFRKKEVKDARAEKRKEKMKKHVKKRHVKKGLNNKK